MAITLRWKDIVTWILVKRKCNLCKKLVEDEIYFLIQCKCLTTVRKQYLKLFDRLKKK